MAEPVSGTTQAGLAVGGVTVVGLFDWIEPGVLIGAFAGSIIFVMSAREYPVWGKLLLFIASLMAGIVAAPFSSSVITLLTPESISASRSVGALVASAVSVRLLMLLGNEPSSLFGRFWPKGRGGDGGK
ncbi:MULTISPECIES: putative holin [unclassified Escherichia]|uniref:putative holin n=1 Tax=Escherichia TaxID=561 RepID=UPI00107F8936|nr:MULTISPECIES: putative holin [unclassified Escherichia]ELD0497430.1 hypothetical protein [Escherichia coli]ELO5000719.1 hypothetical protein [Escherichia coli]ELQ4186380.1 hypothetical protein [Escherichia coli]TGB68906.1 hypothetical protein CRG96_08415 [Escherichia sp. E4930]TGB69111.1 hypothetical protein CRG96_09570 [Escherichia sp. E4930]